jgi:hypothetical protein
MAIGARRSLEVEATESDDSLRANERNERILNDSMQVLFEYWIQ